MEEFDVCTNTTESVWAKISIKGRAPIITGSFYRQDAISSVTQIDELGKILEDIDNKSNKKGNTTIFLGGDFNLPDIDWEIPAVLNNAHR